MGYGIRILVRGPRACFTRPEMKAERVSYDVITPSAARGLIQAIYWKPAIEWRVDRITVLNEIRFETFRRNEVGSKISTTQVRKAMKTGASLSLRASDSKVRVQRNARLLKDVSYLIDYHFTMTDKAGDTDTPKKHYNIALRRLRKGQCFTQPCLGCREFPAYVSLAESDDEPPRSFYEGTGERDLGWMLYDLDYADPYSPKPMFFRASMRDGVIDVARQAREVTS